MREEYLRKALKIMPDTEIYDRLSVEAQDTIRDLGKAVQCKDLGERSSFPQAMPADCFDLQANWIDSDSVSRLSSRPLQAFSSFFFCYG